MKLSETDIALSERSARLTSVASEMDRIIKDVGPKLIKLSHLRAESKSIIEEIKELEKSRR